MVRAARPRPGTPEAGKRSEPVRTVRRPRADLSTQGLTTRSGIEWSGRCRAAEQCFPTPEMCATTPATANPAASGGGMLETKHSVSGMGSGRIARCANACRAARVGRGLFALRPMVQEKSTTTFCAALFPSASSCLAPGRWSVRPTLTQTPDPATCRNHIGVCLDTTSSEYESSATPPMDIDIVHAVNDSEIRVLY